MPTKNTTQAPYLLAQAKRIAREVYNQLAGFYSPILDVSRYQAPINFDIMWSRGVRLLIMRLSVGDYYKDTEVDNFYAAARNKGFLTGFYHVTKPSISVEKQWAWIVQCLGNKVMDIPLILDNEVTDGLNPSTIAAMIEGLTLKERARGGFYPIQYLRGEWWNSNTVYKPAFGKCPLFIARYTSLPHPWNDNALYKPRDWNDYDLWQYSADGNGLGAYYGVGSASVDISRSPVASLDETVARLHKADPIEPPPPLEPVLLKAHVKATSTPYVNRRASPNVNSSSLGVIYPNTNLWVTKIYPKSNGQQWVNLIHPKGGAGENDVAGFSAFTYNNNDLLEWGWV